jgi:DNA-binding response OmpR family regulator
MTAIPGQHVLIVEDDALIALELENVLADEGYEVVGPVNSVGAALACLAADGVHGAVLDVNLGNEDVFSVADALSDSRIPFLFLTGHSDAIVPARHQSRPIMRKPYLASALLAALASTMAGSGA